MKSVFKRIARRFFWGVFVVWATVSIAFLIQSALPSDPARMVAGPQARPQDVERIRKQLGLDRPIYVQYTRFMTRLLHVSTSTDDSHATCRPLGPVHVDLGRSYQLRAPVVKILEERLPRSVFLGFAAVFMQGLLGILAGSIAAARKKQALDRLTVVLTLFGVSVPTFVTGLVLQWIFAYRLHLLPLDGYGTTLSEHLVSVVLPAMTLGVFGAAYYTRMVRDEMIIELGRDYIRTARAKGLSACAVLLRHALRNALMPIVTILGLEVGTLVGGALVTEALFRWPGLGALSVEATLNRDGPLLMGCVIVTSAAVVVSSIVVDVAYLVLDPRVRAQTH